MVTQVIVCLRRLSQNGVKQLWLGQGRYFSKSCRLAAVEGETTSHSGQHSGEGGESSSQTDADSREQEEYDARHRILQASLPFVHQHGWTRKAIAAGAEAEGLSSVAHGMFPRGGAELVHFFYASCNRELAAVLAERVQQQQEGEEKPSTREFIRDALETRLRMIVPYLDTWSQAMAVQTLPQNAFESWTNLRNLVDDIWYYAGDRSVDFNWYTKRASLAGVYKSSEIYMLQDKSEDNADTWAFMERRLQDLQTLAKSAKSASQMGTVMTEGLWGMCIMGRNIFGMNPRNR